MQYVEDLATESHGSFSVAMLLMQCHGRKQAGHCHSNKFNS